MPVFTVSNRVALFANTPTMPGVGPFFPCPLDVRDVVGMPADYLIYCTPDHANPSDGIYLRVCGTGDGTSDPTDPSDWSDYGAHYTANQAAWDSYGVVATSYAIITGMFAGVADTGETAFVQRVGSTWVMTAHSKFLGQGIGNDQQSTWRATSTNGIDWTYDGIILDYDPEQELGRGHTGYFRWGPNPGINQPYDYIGYSLHGGGPGSAYNALWGTDNPVSGTWTKIAITALARGTRWGLTSGYQMGAGWPISNMFRLPTGEWACVATSGLTSSVGANNSQGRLAMVCVADDGYSITREVEVLVSPPLTGGGPDQDEFQNPIVFPDPAHPNDPTKMLVFYQGGLDNGAPAGAINVNTIMVANLTVDLAAALPAPWKRPNHTITEYDLGGGSAPANVTAFSSGAGASIVWDTGFVRSAHTNNTPYAGLIFAQPEINPSTDWHEVEIFDYDRAIDTGGPSNSKAAITRLQIGAGNGFDTNADGYQIICFASIDSDNNHEVQHSQRASSATIGTVKQFQWPLASDTYEATSIRDLAFEYDPATDICSYKTGRGAGQMHSMHEQAHDGPLPNANLRFSWGIQVWPTRMTRVRIRKATSGAGVAPTFTATPASGSVTVTLNKACIGRSGFVLEKDDSGFSPVATTVQRIDDTTLRLTSSELANGDTVRVAYTGGDVRSIADLVEVVEADGDSFTFTAPSAGGRRSRMERTARTLRTFNL